MHAGGDNLVSVRAAAVSKNLSQRFLKQTAYGRQMRDPADQQQRVLLYQGSGNGYGRVLPPTITGVVDSQRTGGTYLDACTPFWVVQYGP